MKYIVPVIVALSVLLISGCAGNIIVAMQPQQHQHEKLLAHVKVNDLRAPGVAASTRQGELGTPMGNISFNPPETVIVQNFLEDELTMLLKEKHVQSPQDFTCDLVDFSVNTNTTPVYWDVIGKVSLVLKHNGKEYKLLGTDTERTFIWPGESIIRRSIDASLKQIADELKHVEL
jgi:hypothetical protein